MDRHVYKIRSAFTLIELLIVVAIIAILAAIAVPNFLEAQTRAKVSRVRADHRTIATGMEMYHIDTNQYPWCNDDNLCFATRARTEAGQKETLERLTTPVSYLNGEGGFYDPFTPTKRWVGPTVSTLEDIPMNTEAEKKGARLYWYTARNAKDSQVWDQTAAQDTGTKWWVLQSSGPDKTMDFIWQLVNQWTIDAPAFRAQSGRFIYDATNGTVSRGSVWRIGGVVTGNAASFGRVVEASQN